MCYAGYRAHANTKKNNSLTKRQKAYRKGLSDYYKNNGIGVELEDVIVTTGGSEALLFGFNSCFDQGDEIIIPEPFYAYLQDEQVKSSYDHMHVQ